MYREPAWGLSRHCSGLLFRWAHTHPVAVSNNRLIDIEDGTVRFRWKDYRPSNRQKVMAVSADEFIRRFLLHVLPEGLHGIRYFASLAIPTGRKSSPAAAPCSCRRRRLPQPKSTTTTAPKELTQALPKEVSSLLSGPDNLIETFDGLTPGPPYQDTPLQKASASFFATSDRPAWTQTGQARAEREPLCLAASSGLTPCPSRPSNILTSATGRAVGTVGASDGGSRRRAPSGRFCRS
ncbi:transposase [Mesorhizobium sp. M0074]|uniref:transposase n=1 Tax=Mesorhizobium sp. M0074 TaxID=2956869 RepID=UPI00333A29CD